jgi:hypothetical protein
VRARAYAWDSLEKIDNCRLSKWAYDRRDQEPDVPLIYLAARWMRPTEPRRHDPGAGHRPRELERPELSRYQHSAGPLELLSERIRRWPLTQGVEAGDLPEEEDGGGQLGGLSPGLSVLAAEHMGSG